MDRCTNIPDRVVATNSTKEAFTTESSAARMDEEKKWRHKQYDIPSSPGNTGMKEMGKKSGLRMD